MDDDIGFIEGILLLAFIGFIVYVIVMIISVLVGIAGTAGLAWGGGTAVVNYYKSFKENIIDSNRTAA